jgi:phenylalanyl-tRNA synthetase beta chain
MKVSLNWLKEYVDIVVPPSELADLLTMAGLEVKGTETIGGSWDNVLVARVKAVNPHPNADRLNLPTVDMGGEEATVVCGAFNFKVDDKVPFARVGARLIDGHTGEVAALKAARIRGVVSNGMLCSEKELGISDRHEGILILPDDAPVGTPLKDYLGDIILDIDVTPNRPDCLSVIGIAREVAALTGQKVRLPEADYEEGLSPVQQRVSVEISDPDLCLRYCATLMSEVKLAESPGWMQRRLLASGMRPINNIVDITNYVMLEYDQPLHAFDYEAVRDGKIIVRRASPGEHLATLDGVDRELSPDMLVIADPDGAVALAGVMGGANSEVTGRTTTILLESANFNPANIHFTARTLRLSSEASMRFERGIRPELTLPAIKRATQLIAELAGGKVARGVVDVYPGEKEKDPIRLSTGKVGKLLGVDFSQEQIVETLTSLGFECQAQSASEIVVTVPYWRNDVNLEVDLIEEVARIRGYDKVPMTMLSQPIPRQNPEPIIGLKRDLRQHLTGLGFQEIITYSLTGRELLNKLTAKGNSSDPAPIKVANPMSAEQEYLRPNLRASLLTALASNRKYVGGGIRLFELGLVYLPRPGDLPDEQEVLCGLLSGPGSESWWRNEDRLIDFYDAKGIIESLLGQLGLEAGFEECSDDGFDATKRASVMVNGSNAGLLGELHARVLDNFEIAGPAYLFELSLKALLPLITEQRLYKPVPRFPATARDISLVLDAGVSHRRLVDIISSFPLVQQVELFDVYSGDQVPQGKKSLAYRVTFQSPSHTLTDKETNRVQQQILDKLSKELGAVLRG